MIKLIKITIKYIKGAYTTDKHNLIIGIPFLQVGGKWHCYSHPNYLCLNVHQVTFDYSILEAYISKTKNDRNKWISDSESWHLECFTRLWQGYNCTNNIHVQRAAQKSCFIYLCTSLNLPSLDAARLFWTFHNKLHNKKALVILSHHDHHFSHLLVFMKKMNFCGSLWALLEYFHEKKTPHSSPFQHRSLYRDLCSNF